MVVCCSNEQSGRKGAFVCLPVCLFVCLLQSLWLLWSVCSHCLQGSSLGLVPWLPLQLADLLLCGPNPSLAFVCEILRNSFGCRQVSHWHRSAVNDRFMTHTHTIESFGITQWSTLIWNEACFNYIKAFWPISFRSQGVTLFSDSAEPSVPHSTRWRHWKKWCRALRCSHCPLSVHFLLHSQNTQAQENHIIPLGPEYVT